MTQIKVNDSKMSGLIDPWGRKISYLRISVTDRCNLRCSYCLPPDGKIRLLPRGELLSYEEIERVVRVAISLGITNFRITGGEPLLRKDISSLIQRLSKIGGIGDLSLTTNGVLLANYAQDLVSAGLKRVNISLDTLDRESFKLITGEDKFEEVLEGIKVAQEVGLSPLKLNVVIMRGVNDQEIPDFIRLTKEYSLYLRFIEFMPLNHRSSSWQEKFLPSKEIIREIRREGELVLSPATRATGSSKVLGSGPARYYKLRGNKGEIGVIDSVSNPFCSACNRLRLTSEGKLKPCLFSSREVDVKAFLRRAEGEERMENEEGRRREDRGLEELFKKTVSLKPKSGYQEEVSILMQRIGG